MLIGHIIFRTMAIRDFDCEYRFPNMLKQHMHFRIQAVIAIISIFNHTNILKPVLSNVTVLLADDVK